MDIPQGKLVSDLQSHSVTLKLMKLISSPDCDIAAISCSCCLQGVSSIHRLSVAEACFARSESPHCTPLLLMNNLDAASDDYGYGACRES